MKRVSRILAAVVACSLAVIAWAVAPRCAFADEQDMWDTIERFTLAEQRTYDSLVCDPGQTGYGSFIESLAGDDVFIEISADVIDARLSEGDYARILAEVLSYRQRGLAAQIEEQTLDVREAEFGTTLSAVSLAESVVERFSPDGLQQILSVLDSGADTVIENADQAKAFMTVYEDYCSTERFFKAVADHAQDEALVSVARRLLNANDSLLEARLTYLSDNVDNFNQFTFDAASELLEWDNFIGSGLDADDLVVRDFADAGSAVLQALMGTSSDATFAFDVAIKAGDLVFGTTNTFKRYEEMKALADIAQALVAEADGLSTDRSVGAEQAYENMLAKADLYHFVVTVHARGEYLLYQLVSCEGGILSSASNFLDQFKDPSETTEGWYQARMGVLTDLDASLDVFTGALSPDSGGDPASDTSFDDAVKQLSDRYGVIATGTDTYEPSGSGTHYGAVVPSDRLDGILACDVFDYDGDGQDELLCVRAEPEGDWSQSASDGAGGTTDVVLEMYESNDGNVELAASVNASVDRLPIPSMPSAVHVFRGSVKGKPAVYLDYGMDFNDLYAATLCLTYDGSFAFTGGAALFSHYDSVICYQATGVDALTHIEMAFSAASGWSTLSEAMAAVDGAEPPADKVRQVGADYQDALAAIGLADSAPRSDFLTSMSGSRTAYVCEAKPADHFTLVDGGDVSELGGIVALQSSSGYGKEITCYDETGLVDDYR